jgi:hypothetical protein
MTVVPPGHVAVSITSWPGWTIVVFCATVV